jgi:hypothetical protein
MEHEQHDYVIEEIHLSAEYGRDGRGGAWTLWGVFSGILGLR